VRLTTSSGQARGLLALAVGAGLPVMSAMMDADVATLAGVKGKHDSDRAAVRHGHERGSVTLGGRRVPVDRPRVRAVHGSGELPVPAYELFSSTEILGRMAMDRMLAGLSTRRYQIGLEPVGQQVGEVATSTSRSAVSRKFVAQTETALAELLSADLSTLDLVAMMIDGVHFAESCCVVALGIDLQGTKHPLALVEGSTENATLTTDLLVGLRDRGLDVTRPILVVLDGLAMRWCAAGMVEAGKQFRRVNGHLHLASLRAALEREAPKLSEPPAMMTWSAWPDEQRAATEVPRNSGHPLSQKPNLGFSR